jgi:hypothetical protein
MVVRKGGRVAILDVKAPDPGDREEMERWDLVWEVVDVSDGEGVKRAVERVVEEVGLHFFIVLFVCLLDWGMGLWFDCDTDLPKARPAHDPHQQRSIISPRPPLAAVQ